MTQIVGSSLQSASTATESADLTQAVTNFESQETPTYFAKLYQGFKLQGGHFGFDGLCLSGGCFPLFLDGFSFFTETIKEKMGLYSTVVLDIQKAGQSNTWQISAKRDTPGSEITRAYPDYCLFASTAKITRRQEKYSEEIGTKKDRNHQRNPIEKPEPVYIQQLQNKEVVLEK